MYKTRFGNESILRANVRTMRGGRIPERVFNEHIGTGIIINSRVARFRKLVRRAAISKRTRDTWSRETREIPALRSENRTNRIWGGGCAGRVT